MQSRVYQADWLDQLSTGVDFRIKKDAELADTIAVRAQHLRGHDRELVLAMYRDGLPATQIARVGNLDPRQVRRRIKIALARMADPVFIFVLTHKSGWSTTRRKVARSIFQAGLSIRQTAESLDLKIHQVRRHRAAIIEQYESSCHQNAKRSPDRNWRYPK